MTGEGKKPTLLQHLGLYGYKALNFFLKLSDVRYVALFGRSVGYLVWFAIPSRRRIVARNLRIAVDPKLRPKQLGTLVRRNIVRTSMNLACALKTGLMTDKEEARAIRMEGADLFEEHGLNGHTVISCIPHAGNWEILARIRPHFPRVEHFGSMYRRMSNPLLEKLVYASRTRYGCEMFSKEDGLRSVLKLAKTGGLLGVLSDQFTQEGLYLPYFGKVTGVTPLPALLYRRCKGKASLFAVFTRNTGLGRWDAVLGREIPIPEEERDNMAAITLRINRALEANQSENILDGFWMHHRWKCTGFFAIKQTPEVEELSSRSFRLPFRIIICMPEDFDEALMLFPALKTLKACRCDAQINIICPQEQLAFWNSQSRWVSHCLCSDGSRSVAEQLDADEIYNDGPFDIAFMFSENKATWKALRGLIPLRSSGFEENRLSRGFNDKVPDALSGPPKHRSENYLNLLKRSHNLTPSAETLAEAPQGNDEAEGCYIAPFSSLGSADSWPEDKWAELLSSLPPNSKLIALENQRSEAEAMAKRLGVESLCLKAEDFACHFGKKVRLYAVDGLIPQLAALYGASGSVLMASRLAAVYSPLGGKFHAHSSHKSCHPCYRRSCDAAVPCCAEVTVEEMLS